jgi:hypothetical protein
MVYKYHKYTHAKIINYKNQLFKKINIIDIYEYQSNSNLRLYEYQSNSNIRLYMNHIY